MFKKALFGIVGLALVVSPLSVSATTVAELQAAVVRCFCVSKSVERTICIQHVGTLSREDVLGWDRRNDREHWLCNDQCDVG